MNQTTVDAHLLKTLTASGEKKTHRSFLAFFSVNHMIPLLALLLFGVVALRALYPETFHFGFKRQKIYHFRNDSLGFFIGDIEFFINSSQEEAEQKMVELFPQSLRPKVERIIRPVLVLCEKHQLDPFWVLSVMWTESHFKHESVSRKGARGLMQVMPPTFMETLGKMKRQGFSLEADKGEDYLRYQYRQTFYEMGHARLVSKLKNLEVGIFYLKRLLEAFNENHYYATVAYNMGPGWTRRRLRKNMPVGNKNHYLNKVLKNYNHITKTLSQHSNVTFIPRI